MTRRNLDRVKSTVLRHNAILKEHGFSLRERHRMINRFNHVKVSLATLQRWGLEDVSFLSQSTTQERDTNETLTWKCPECNGKLRFGLDNGELACSSCGLVVERIRIKSIDLGQQIESYQPTLASSFNKGLGTPISKALLTYVAREVVRSRTVEQLERKGTLTRKEKRRLAKARKKLSYARYGDQMRLRPFTSGQDVDGKMNTMLTHLTKRMREIQGFDPTSDNDSQFGELNALGRFVRQARAKFKESSIRFKSKPFIDALLFCVYGQSVRPILEAPSKRLLCPRCQRKRRNQKSQLPGQPFATDQNPEFYLCCSCGLQIPKHQAEFKVYFDPIDPVYVKTIQNLMSSKSGEDAGRSSEPVTNHVPLEVEQGAVVVAQ